MPVTDNDIRIATHRFGNVRMRLEDTPAECSDIYMPAEWYEEFWRPGFVLTPFKPEVRETFWQRWIRRFRL